MDDEIGDQGSALGGHRSSTSFDDHTERLVALIRDLQGEGWRVDLAPDAGDPADDGVWQLVDPAGRFIASVRHRWDDTSNPVAAALVLALDATTSLSEARAYGRRATVRAEHAEAQALLDPLTGVPNRRAWEGTLRREEARCARNGLGAVVAVVDVNELKRINDSAGHLAGDLVLRMTARALGEAVRDTDVVARLGGDEFAVLAVDWDGPVPGSLVDRLEQALADAGVAAAVGAAFSQPGASLVEAFADADWAMYRAKGASRVGDDEDLEQERRHGEPT